MCKQQQQHQEICQKSMELDREEMRKQYLAYRPAYPEIREALSRSKSEERHLHRLKYTQIHDRRSLQQRVGTGNRHLPGGTASDLVADIVRSPNLISVKAGRHRHCGLRISSYILTLVCV